MCVCVCVCDTQSFQQSQSVRYHTAPLYSNVRTAAMFGRPPPAAFPPSLHNTKTTYSRSVPPTAPCIPICLLLPRCRGPLVGEPATAHGDGVTGMVLLVRGSQKQCPCVCVCVCVCVCDAQTNLKSENSICSHTSRPLGHTAAMFGLPFRCCACLACTTWCALPSPQPRCLCLWLCL